MSMKSNVITFLTVLCVLEFTPFINYALTYAHTCAMKYKCNGEFIYSSFYAPASIDQGHIGFCPVCLSVCYHP